MVLESKRIEGQREKFVLLMTRGSKDIREIYKNQTPCEDEVTQLKPPLLVIPDYDNAIARLDKYFSSKINARMELERFRSLKQDKDEDFAKFVLRLRAQAKRCNFGTRTEEEILHQATREALDEKVRDKRIDINITLEQLIQFAIGREILKEHKSKSAPIAWEGKTGETVMMVSGQKTQLTGRFETGRRDGNFKRPFRRGNNECDNCSSWRHKTGDVECKAAKMKCFNCGKLGHMAVKCRSAKKVRTNTDVQNINDGWEDETPKRGSVKSDQVKDE